MYGSVVFTQGIYAGPVDIVAILYRTGTLDPPKETRNVWAARCLLVIALSPPYNPNYDQFHAEVNRYNELPPFEFPNPFKKPKQVYLLFETLRYLIV